MYVPASFRIDDLEAMHAFMERHDFALLVSTVLWESGTTPFATHLPLTLDRTRGEYGALLGHIARANPQWRQLEEHPSALVVFRGPHAYVTPTWYEEPLNVPTWNYVAVHARVVARVTHDAARLREILTRLVDAQEASFPDPWSIDRLPEEYVAQSSRGIVGFELEITHLDGKAKLSQNRSPRDRANVADHLARSADPTSRATGELMRATQSRDAP